MVDWYSSSAFYDQLNANAIINIMEKQIIFPPLGPCLDSVFRIEVDQRAIAIGKLCL